MRVSLYIPRTMSTKLKIGIIQNTPITADLSNNLRQIVQGYRECLDHNADLVIAPAYALCGAGVKDLANRTSFLQQTAAALDVLAQELGSTPLLLAAYAPMPSLLLPGEDDSEVMEEPELWYDTPKVGILVPYLLENDGVTELQNAEIIDINGLQVYVDVNDDEILLDEEEADVIVHLATGSWHANSAHTDEELRRWEAKSNNCPVVCVHPVTTADEILYGGGSGIYLPGNITHTRLPFFEACAKVASLNAKGTAKALPGNEEILSQALEQGIRDTMRFNGYVGVCLSLDEPNSVLLAALCAEAVGASNVHGISFTQNSHQTELLNINIKHFNDIEISADLQAEFNGTMGNVLNARLRTTILTTYADRYGLLPLSNISRHDVMMNNFVLYGNAGGYLAPLGNMYEMDIYMLSTYFNEKYDGLFGILKEPDHPEQDRIIHELQDRNISAGTLLHDHVCPFSEEEVRYVQRRIISSAQKRSQLPMVLRIDNEDERNDFPSHHRLND